MAETLRTLQNTFIMKFFTKNPEVQFYFFNSFCIPVSSVISNFDDTQFDVLPSISKKYVSRRSHLDIKKLKQTIKLL